MHWTIRASKSVRFLGGVSSWALLAASLYFLFMGRWGAAIAVFIACGVKELLTWKLNRYILGKHPLSFLTYLEKELGSKGRPTRVEDIPEPKEWDIKDL